MAEALTALYWYCTDFCVNMANLLGISYVEFNIWLFLIVLPGLIGILVLLNLRRYVLLPLMRRWNS
ncbi:MAG: hypothetical protein AAFQ68_00185 [Bacteroidota bacterium]